MKLEYIGIPVGIILCIWMPYIFLPIFLILAIWARLWEIKKQMEWFADLREHIYVVMIDPATFERHTVPGADHLIFHSHERKMAETVRQLETKLKLSGNRYINDPKLKPAQRIRVIPVFMRSGEFINETSEEFQERLKTLVYKNRADWHGALANGNYSYYVKYHHQNGTTEFETNLEVD